SARVVLPGAAAHRAVRSFPTRRSSDLRKGVAQATDGGQQMAVQLARRSNMHRRGEGVVRRLPPIHMVVGVDGRLAAALPAGQLRSEEHTSELQSRENLVCRLLLEKKNN